MSIHPNQTIPVPGDIPLSLPLPEHIMVFLLVFSFLLHILFVNLMLGGTLLTLYYEWKGKTDNSMNILAKKIAETITVNKSLAVVLGVAPLLTINALYTIHFYSANALTGTAWISVIPLVITAFLLVYLYKYTWDRMSDKKNVHISIGAVASFIFLLVPLIFLSNVNLMLFPDKWSEIKGFWSAVFISNVIPRYLHFLCASLAITGLFLFWYFRKYKLTYTEKKDEMNITDTILNKFLKLTMWATLTQLALGTLNLLTLPSSHLNTSTVIIILSGATLAMGACILLWKGIHSDNTLSGKGFATVVIILTITVGFMGSGRHMYRASALATHKKQISKQNEVFQLQSHNARMAFEKQVGLQIFVCTTEKAPDWVERSELVKQLLASKGIDDISFNLKNKTIEIRYRSSEITDSEILNTLEKVSSSPILNHRIMAYKR